LNAGSLNPKISGNASASPTSSYRVNRIST
jgi:hypothetical protein